MRGEGCTFLLAEMKKKLLAVLSKRLMKSKVMTLKCLLVSKSLIMYYVNVDELNKLDSCKTNTVVQWLTSHR